jgi:glutamine---fructose-6-phosphate transaminase (isomerizing)
MSQHYETNSKVNDSNFKSFTYQEILSQPEVWQATLTALNARRDEIRTWFNLPVDDVIFTGCGSTYYLSLHNAVVWQALTGTNARGIPASEIWLFPGIHLTKARYLLVAVSRSASTTETLLAVKTFKEKIKRDPIVISCYPDRALSRSANLLLVAEQAAEVSVAQTRSFTSMSISASYLAGVAAGRKDFIAELNSLPAALKRVFEENIGAVEVAGKDMHSTNFIFLGSGANYGIACEAMIKMKEISLSHSEAFHFMELRHGPKSVVGSDTMVVGFVGDTARQEEAKVLAEMESLGAKILTLGEAVGDLPGTIKIDLESGIGELARGVLALPVVQLLACFRAEEKGLDPDSPKNLTQFVQLN